MSDGASQTFVMMWDHVLDAPVSAEAKCMWAMLVRECFRHRVRRQYLDQPTLADRIRASVKSVQRWTSELERAGLCRVERGTDKGGKFCHYYPWWPEAPNVKVRNSRESHQATRESLGQATDQSHVQATDQSHVVYRETSVDQESPLSPGGGMPDGTPQPPPKGGGAGQGAKVVPAKTRKERERLGECRMWVGKPCAECGAILTESDNTIRLMPNGERLFGIVRFGHSRWIQGKRGPVEFFDVSEAKHLACSGT